MTTRITKQDLTIWKDDALNTLEQAQRLCTDAQSLLEVTAFTISKLLPRKLECIHLANDELKNQNQKLFIIIDELKREVYEGIIKAHNKELDDILEPSLSELDSILSELKTTAVPSNLVVSSNTNEELNPESDSKFKNLIEFISYDAIDILIKNIQIYRRNTTKIKKALNFRFEKEIGELHQLRFKKLNKITLSYNEMLSIELDLKQVSVSSPFNDNNQLITILKENSSLENELGSILEMITNHYDQCSKALLLYDSASTRDEDLQILCEDTKELPEVLKELNAIHEIITNNENRTHKYLQSKFNMIDKLSALIHDQLNLNRNLRSKILPGFIVFCQQCKDRLCDSSIKSLNEEEKPDPIKVYSDTLRDLIFHYRQFISIYKSKYLQEYHREKYIYPKKYLKKLSDFLRNELEALQEEENNRRGEWLAKYGEFIPREFKLPGQTDQPAVVQVVTEGLDDIQGSYNDGKFSENIEEVELLRFIDNIK